MSFLVKLIPEKKSDPQPILLLRFYDGQMESLRIVIHNHHNAVFGERRFCNGCV